LQPKPDAPSYKIKNLVERKRKKMPAINIRAAIEKIQGFGYSAGYIQTATFLIGEPGPAPGRELPRQIVVSVYELERLAQSESESQFVEALNRLADIPLRGAPGPGVTALASA
jgi:hypothetical protein